MRQAGLNPNRLTNTWVPFLITSSLLLSDRGRLGMIIPAELFQVNYASESRQFLSDYFSKISIITFNHLVFDDIQQEIVLFLGEKNGENKGITITQLDDASDLDLFDYEASFKEDAKPMDHSKEKWTQYFLDRDEIELLRTLKAHPMIMRTGELFQVVFTEEDWQQNVDLKRAAFLFAPDLNNGKRLSKEAREYIKLGEELGVQRGYKCSIRKNWFVVPTLWVPDAFMLRQVHEYPMLILNQAEATSTDTIHRVRFENSDFDHDTITAAFMNTLTFAFAEVTGRSYGGGVLTFEPSEAENLPIPLEGANRLNLEELNKVLKNEGIEAVLDITDEILLIKELGLSEEDVATLRNIWEKLRDRRINRKRKRIVQDLVPV
jgi:adenine-specific DNA-methyltransferase